MLTYDVRRKWTAGWRGRTGASSLRLGIALVCLALLQCRSTEPAPKPKPAAPVRQRVVLLMHGHGAARDDLLPLSQRLQQLAPKVRFELPGAPHDYGRGASWYPPFESAKPEEAEQLTLELRAQARQVVFDFIDRLAAEGVRESDIYVGGFSQGATVALDVVSSQRGAHLGGLISLSGGALDLDLGGLARRAPLRAFVSHGSADPRLPQRKSLQLVRALQQEGHSVRWVPFGGGHSIPPEVVQALGQFLAEP